MNKSGRKKGCIPWNKGIKGYKQPNISKALKGKYLGEKSGKWQGDDIGYGTLHEWVSRMLGKPSLCKDCGTTDGVFDWANKSGKYKRNLTDWIRLCRVCHRKYDNHSEKLKKAWERGAYLYR